MKSFKQIRIVLVTVAALALVATACKKEEPKKSDPPKAEVKEEPKAAEPPVEASPVAAPAAASPTGLPGAASPVAAGPAAETVITPGAKFMFDLAASPGAMEMATAKCEMESAGDAEKKAKCIADVPKQAAKEGIRFEKEGEQWFYVSFENKDDGKEEVHLRAPIAKVAGLPHEFKFKPAGPGTGTKAAEMGADKFDAAAAEQMIMALATVDATSIALDAGPKGRIFFRLAK